MSDYTWANATFTYEFVCTNGKVFRGATLGIDIVQEKVQPNFNGSNIKCDLDRVFTLETTHAEAKPQIFWSDDIFGVSGDARLLLGDNGGVSRDIALFKLTDNQIWIVRSEPNLEGRLTITVSNEKHKVLLIGVGDLVEIDLKPIRPEVPPKKAYQLIVTLRESYKWKFLNPTGCAHCQGSVRTTSPAPTASGGDYDVPDGGSCFAAGTPVMLPRNVIIPIERLLVGDLVMARDEETGELAAHRVKHLYMHNVQSTLLVELSNGEEIETTPEHQFALEQTGFIPAGKLKSGSRLITHDKASTEVVGTRPRISPSVVYNIEVDRFHTYFVGQTGAWVHNMRKEK